MTRQEHLDWCKKRAFEYLDQGQVMEAFTSMGSDLDKHPETKGHMGVSLGLQLFIAGNLRSVEDMRHFIEGFN